jgi:TrpR-related protein YerC/YecD
MVKRSKEVSDAAKERERLYRAVLSLRTVEECEQFFRDLCTLSEIDALTERWHVARELHRGRSYRAVSRTTGASTTTVTRVAHWLRNGTGGYRVVLDRLIGKPTL